MPHEDILDEQESTYIQQFWENEKMREAVKKILLAGMYENGVLKKTKKSTALRNVAFNLVSTQGISNEQVGADLRALWEGINAVELAFNQMSKYKKEKMGEPKINEAR